MRRRSLRALLLYAASPQNRTLSYQVGWPNHFRRHPRFDCVSLNVLDRGMLARLRANYIFRRMRFEVVIMLHSVFSNSCYVKDWLFDEIRVAARPKVYFIGNEYKLMPEKMSFCEEIGVSLLISQSRSPAVHEIYRERLGCAVAGIVSAGLDPAVFYPRVDREDRHIDLGYRVYRGPLFLGHDDRSRIADYFVEYGPRFGLNLSISLDPNERFPPRQWAEFLNQCKGQLGTEAGSDYFELSDDTRKKVNDFVECKPGATMAEISERFFKSYLNPVPLRTISGRNAEAAGTKTVQILFEGEYDGYFQPDVHYIRLQKDFSNVEDVMARFRDESYCREVTDNAYEVAVQELSYEKLIDQFHGVLLKEL